MAEQAETLAPQAASRKAPAAYVPFRTFLSAIEALEHGVPRKLDRTIWRSQSGVIQSQIMMAFRFFNLVDEDDRPTQALHRLVASPEQRPEQVKALLHYAYHDIIDHDLTKMTPRMLEEAMDHYSVTGDTRRRAISFFLQAAKYAELPMHPLLLGQTRNTSGTRKRKAKRPGFVPEMNGAVDPTYQLAPTRGSEKSVHLSSGGAVTLSLSYDPFALSEEDRKFVFELVDKLKAYAEANPPSDEDENEEDAQ
jgi:hypothetical protein